MNIPITGGLNSSLLTSTAKPPAGVSRAPTNASGMTANSCEMMKEIGAAQKAEVKLPYTSTNA